MIRMRCARFHEALIGNTRLACPARYHSSMRPLTTYLELKETAPLPGEPTRVLGWLG